ncbi:MAG: hypothetical protein M3R70_09400 [Actinomycetota bacterium]|nr:hypothetical protein [Actinomycetota bacterium]
MRTIVAFVASIGIGAVPAASGAARLESRGAEYARTPLSAFDPVWSRDGLRLAYLTSPGGDNRGGVRVNSVRPDGSGYRTGARVDGMQVSFAPGLGRLVLYHASSNMTYVENFDGSERRAMGVAGRPAWSPKGNNIALARFGDPNAPHVFLVRPDGSDIRRIDLPMSRYGRFAWAPDGRRFAIADVGNQSPGILVGDLGGHVRRIIAFTTPREVVSLVWSPDGSRVAFIEDEYPDQHVTYFALKLEVVGASGGQVRRLIPSAVPELERGGYALRSLSWSPDGKALAFTREVISASTPAPLIELDTIDVASRGVRPVVVGGQQPVWSPARGAIVFRARGRCNADRLIDGLFVFRFRGRAVEKLTRCPQRSRLLRPLYGTRGADTIRGSALPELLNGLSGSDRLFAGAGDDILIGGPGRNVLSGGPGDDWIQPGAGPNRISCGSGYDVVVGADRRRADRDCERVSG